MRLRNVEFPPVMNAAGARNFLGKGYPFHRYLKPFGLTFENCGFISKTVTLDEKEGNMPLKKDGVTPREWKPCCITIKPTKGLAMNAVGLSNFGLRFYLNQNKWQQRSGFPFFISIMSVQKTANDRLTEIREVKRLLQKSDLPNWHTDVGIELNLSCPNVGTDIYELVKECHDMLNVLARLHVPIQVKINALVNPAYAEEIAHHDACDAITMGNTIPWRACGSELPGIPHENVIRWDELFGTNVSPLAKFGGGGLSGAPLLPIICSWIKEARDFNFPKPIWACGGIMSTDVVHKVKEAGASGIQLGSVAFLRPQRMKSIIARGYELFGS